MTPAVDLAQVAYETLRGDIVRWDLAPGVVLGEADLARRVQMSRTPVRDALKRLTREGLVRGGAGRGVEVSPLTVEQVVSLFQAREALEPYAFRLIARSDHRHEFGAFVPRIDATLARDPVEVDEMLALVEEFDAVFDVAVGNDFIVRALRELRVHTTRVRHLLRRSPERYVASAHAYRELCEALVAGDGDAAAALQTVRINDGLHVVVDLLTPTLVGAPTPDPLQLRPVRASGS